MPRAVVLAVLAVLVPVAPAAAEEIEAFSSPAIVSGERYHELGGHEYVMRFVPRFAPEPAMPTRVVLPLERRPGTSPGPVTVRLGYWTDSLTDPLGDYWIAQPNGMAEVPESAIPVASGRGYSGGTVDVTVPSSIPIGDGNVQTIVVSAGGEPGDIVLGAADPVDSWNIAKARPLGGEWTPVGVFGLRFFVVPQLAEPPTPTWPFDGFYTPVDAEPTVNVVTAGSSVPFRFSVGGDRGPDVLAAAPSVQRVPCDPSVPSDVLEETAASSQTGLSYEAVHDRYLYVWRTEKEMAGTCQRFVLRLADGTSHSALFRMR